MIGDYGVKAMFTAPTAYRAIKRDDPDGLLMRGHDLTSLHTVFSPASGSTPTPTPSGPARTSASP